MRSTIKSALNQIKAEDRLISKTESTLRNFYEKPKHTMGVLNKRRGVFKMKRIAVAACAVVVMLGLSVGGYAYYQTPVSYLSLDINPSVELGVNAFGRVVSAKGYNADGELILNGHSVVNFTVNDAVKKLVTSASENGFIKDDGSTIVSLTSETNNGKAAAKLQKAAEQGANDALEASGDTAVVYKDNVALARIAEARTLDITPGKLNLIQMLQALDPSVTVDQYKDASVRDIMKKVVELRKGYATQTDIDTEDVEDAAAQSDKNAEKNTEKNTEKNADKNAKDNVNNNLQGNANSQSAVSPSGNTTGSINEDKNGNGNSSNNKGKNTTEGTQKAHGNN